MINKLRPRLRTARHLAFLRAGLELDSHGRNSIFANSFLHFAERGRKSRAARLGRANHRVVRLCRQCVSACRPNSQELRSLELRRKNASGLEELPIGQLQLLDPSALFDQTRGSGVHWKVCKQSPPPIRTARDEVQRVMCVNQFQSSRRTGNLRHSEG